MSRTDVDALNATFMQGMEKKDPALVASVYAADARLLAPGTDALTGPAIAGYWEQLMGLGMDSGTLETLSFEEHGDVAIEEGVYRIQAGGAEVDHGKYVVVHRRQGDGSWKFGVDIFNSSRPEAAPDT